MFSARREVKYSHGLFHHHRDQTVAIESVHINHLYTTLFIMKTLLGKKKTYFLKENFNQN